jgi:uncharacterized protein (TIGR00251 family)
VEAWRVDGAGLTLFVRVTPRAGADAVDGVQIRDDGRAELRVRVRAVPEDGRANRAVAELIAHILDVPKSNATVVSGSTGRSKTLLIAGDGAGLAAKAQRLLGRANKSR